MNSQKRNQLRERIRTLEGLTADERSALLGLLAESKPYGLVWEEKPEDVEERLREELPILREVPERAIISDDPDAPNHILIEGDNLEALSTLAYTHEGRIDVIYIDPPYNTGNKDFVYNDSFVDREDAFRHSKWLSFMAKRLRIAKKLLSERGVIFISIDDNEQAQLKLLCDEVFGEGNFVANFIWRGGKRNMSKWVSTSHEYMLLYANDLNACNNINVEWFEKKRGLDEIYAAAKKFVKESASDFNVASKLLKEWFKRLPDDNPSKDHKHYCWIDNNGVYFASDISRGGGGGPTWPIINPLTHELVKTPSRGWAYPTLEALQEDINNGLVHFNGDGVPCKKRYLKDNETQILETVFYKDRRASSKRLRDLMGNDSFPFPKDDEILKEKLDSFSTTSSTVLDFFAGSGTTLHAVMQLNSEDGGHRQCILVTNNENGICENVTYERNRRVIQGYTTPRGEARAGLAANTLRYYRTDFISRSRSLRNMRQLVRLATDMLCIKENIYTELREFGGQATIPAAYRAFREGGRQMLVVYSEEAVEDLAELICGMDLAEPIIVYVFSPSEDVWNEQWEDVREKVRLTALPAAIYNTYRRILPRRRDTPPATEQAAQGADGKPQPAQPTLFSEEDMA